MPRRGGERSRRERARRGARGDDSLTVDIRPLREDELGTWVELANALDPRLPETVETFRRHLRVEPTARHLVAVENARVVGIGTAEEPADRRGADAGWLSLGVLPERRRHGIGTALYGELSAHLRTLGKSAADTWVWSDNADARAFLERRGFVEVERFDYARLDLETYEPLPRTPPAGVELVPRSERPGCEREMYDVLLEGLADMPSADELQPSYDDFVGWEIEHPTRRADLSFLALHDGEVVGYATLGAVGQTGDATNVMTVVRREWRRRGVASALKAAQLAAAKRAGFRGLVTFNEVRNEPMRRLNERLGYRAQPPQLRMRGPLAEASVGRE